MDVLHLILQYVRLDYKTDFDEISKFLFDIWKMDKPDIIFSVIHDSDCSPSEVKEVIEAKEPIQNITQMICSSLVNAAASTSAYTLFCLYVNLSTCRPYVYMRVCIQTSWIRNRCMWVCLSICMSASVSSRLSVCLLDVCFFLLVIVYYYLILYLWSAYRLQRSINRWLCTFVLEGLAQCPYIRLPYEWRFEP